MRVYVGELDEAGRARVWVAQETERVDLAELVDVLGQLRALSDPVIGPGLDREGLLVRKAALVERIEATASVAPPVELVHRALHSPDGFGWGPAVAGGTDLARSVLCVETGEDVGPEVYLRFRDEVVAALPHRTHFRLGADEVWSWLEANRELVERSAFERPAQAVVADAGPEAGQEVMGDDAATASAVVAACEAAWEDIRRHHPELPDAVMILGTGVERGRLAKLGHWWGARWVADGQVRGEVLLAGEALHLPAGQVFEVLLHEAAHGINAARGVKDTSRGGRYHNQRFAETARQVMLRVRATPPYGLAGTSLTPEAAERYGATIERLGEQIRIARQLERSTSAGVEGPGGGDGGGGNGSGNGGRGRGARAASCGCGRRLRMAPSVLARGPVLCGVCHTEFTAGAEVATGAPDRPGARVANRAQAGGQLREVVAARRAAVTLALEGAGGGAPPPGWLRDRHRHLGDLLDRLDGPSPVVPGSLDDERLARWYEDRGTLREGPMAAADASDAARLTGLVRELLDADGTLSGPAVEAGGRQFRAGDRVIATAEVPGGPAAGVPGMVTEADPELGALRVDFPTWGEVRTPLASALAGVVDHDYAVVAVPEREAAPAAAAGPERELPPGPAAGW